jgi:hypothetical protein
MGKQVLKGGRVIKIRCIKCSRPLRDPESIARGMGPECAGASGGYRKRYSSRVRSNNSSRYAASDPGSLASPTLFTLVEESQCKEERSPVEEIRQRKNHLMGTLLQFPNDLIDLVLSAPRTGSIAARIKNYSRKTKPAGSIQPGRILQEIRQTCIELRLTFWPGMSTLQGQQIACVPDGDDGWRFENSERVMSRQELESYLARYGMIRLADR